MEKLVEMLAFKRPAFSVYEEAFIDKYIRPLGCKEDKFGNLRLDVGSKPDVLWSSHTDTVHTSGGLQEIIVKRGIASVHPMLRSNKKHASNCLGADCTTGVWLMLEMIDAGVPGRYVFHRDEEAGGHGSIYIRDKRTTLLDGIKFAIAFDRKGKFDIITHQGNVRTASDKFAASMAEQLGMGFRKNDWGMFTDTKNYRGIVPECTNISVGYEHAHSSSETQDLDFAKRLRDKMVVFDASKLVCDRDPKVIEHSGWGGNWNGGYTRYTLFEHFIRSNPEAIVDLFENMGMYEQDVREYVGAYHKQNRTVLGTA